MSTGAGDLPPPRPARPTRINRKAEDDALACLDRGSKEAALRILMDAYGNNIVAFVFRMVRNDEVAKDVRQTVFLEAFQGIEKFERRSSLWTWLCSIAVHRAADEHKRMKRTGPSDESVWDKLAQQPDLAMDGGRVQKRRALEDCLGKFDAPVRAQLLMRFFLGLSHAEIGEMIGEAHGTVQVRISRALPKLRKCLKKNGAAR